MQVVQEAFPHASCAMCLIFTQVVQIERWARCFSILFVGCLYTFNAPRLEIRRPAIDNKAKLTGRNHLPGKRQVSEDWKDAKSKVKIFRVCNARGKKTKGGKEVETTWICKGCPGEPGLCVEKDCSEVYHTNLDFSQ